MKTFKIIFKRTDEDRPFDYGERLIAADCEVEARNVFNDDNYGLPYDIVRIVKVA